MENNTKKDWKLLAISLVIILAGSLLANAIQTVGGSVTVKDVRWADSGGAIISAFLYIPDGVSVDNPAPAVLVVGGGDTNRESLSNWALEFARRGYVVLNLDMKGHGYTEEMATRDNGYGGPAALRYLHSLDIIDHDNVGMVGHSMGGVAIAAAGQRYPDGYKAMVVVGASTNTGNDETLPQLKNFAYICGIDDGCTTNQSKIKRISSIYGTTDLVSIPAGKTLGSFEDGTGRALYWVPYPHATEIITPGTLKIIIDWIQQIVPPTKEISPSNQIWIWKYIGSLIAMVGLLMFFFPLGAILLRTPFFKSIEKPVPEFKGLTGKAWWIGAILTVLIPVGSLFYMHTVTSKLLPATKLWPMGRPNGIMGWALFGAIVTIILILVNHYVLKGDRNATAHNYGLTGEDGKIEWCNIGKSLLLSFSLFGIGYIVLVLVYRWLLVDFRIFEVSFRLLTPLRFRIVLQYLIPWIFAYIVLSANLHGLMRPKDGSISFCRELLINIILMALFYYLWWPAFYGPLYSGAPEFFAGGTMKYWVWAFPPTLVIVAAISTYFFRKTGRVYVGAFLNAILVVWTMVGGNSMGIFM